MSTPIAFAFGPLSVVLALRKCHISTTYTANTVRGRDVEQIGDISLNRLGLRHFVLCDDNEAAMSSFEDKTVIVTG